MGEHFDSALQEIFGKIRKSLSPSRRFSHFYWPGAAARLVSRYGVEHLAGLMDRVDTVHEHILEDGVERSRVLEKEKVIDRVRQGTTLVCNGLHTVDDLTARCSAELMRALEFNGKPSARIFYTNALAHAYALHIDSFFTLTFQISGKKLWKIARQAEPIDFTRLNHSILAPSPGVIEDYPSGRIIGPPADDGWYDQVLLGPGDMMLIHPAVWHHVIPVSESFSVAMDVMPPSQADDSLSFNVINHPGQPETALTFPLERP